MPTDDAATSILADERSYLARARTELGRMRERTLALSVHSGDAVSAQYLAATLYRRALSLLDDPGTALFFGRTDHASGERWYVGRRHVADAAGDPVVVDWRADISRGFYQASATEPMGVVRRRRFGIESGEITAFEDESLSSPTSGTGTSQILAREIERPRVGPMRDIVATIQPEQDVVVRADIAISICIQGAPGTGKTAVGLHRAAWLLYAHRDQLARSGVLVVGPNAAFLEHIAAVLPSLGEVEVKHATVDGLVASRALPPKPRRSGSQQPSTPDARLTVGAGDPRRERLLGDPRMAELARRAVWSAVGRANEALVVPRGSRRWRLPAYQVNEIVEELIGRGARYNAARSMLLQRLAHAVLTLMEADGDSPDDRVQDAVARSTPVKRYAAAIWPQTTPARVLFDLLSDPERLRQTSQSLLDSDELSLLPWTKPARSPQTVRWTPAELALLDELADLLDRTPSLGHVVLDEAQDLSPMQLRAVARRCSTGSVTVLGDLAQGTTAWATDSWAQALTHLGHPDAEITELSQGFRVPSSVIDFAAQLLPAMAPELSPPTSVRQESGALRCQRVQEFGELAPATAVATMTAEAEPGSIGVIVADSQLEATVRALHAVGISPRVLAAAGAAQEIDTNTSSEHLLSTPAGGSSGETRVNVIAAGIAKGLEYDHVVVCEPAAIAAAEPDRRSGLRRLYVVLTRAVSTLHVVYCEPLPEPLLPPAENRG